MTLYCAQGGPDRELSYTELHDYLFAALEKLGTRKNVLAIPPDYTRIASRAGELTRYAWEYFGENLRAVLPALGTHHAMSPEQISSNVRRHPARSLPRPQMARGCGNASESFPADFICEQSEGKLNYEWPAQVNRLMFARRFRSDSLHRSSGAARSDRHGQLQ